MNASRTVAPKWRPTLSMITFAAIGLVLAAPLAGLLLFRLYETQLIRETEGQLIGQTTVLAATLAHEVAEARAAAGDAAPPLGVSRPPRPPSPDDPLTPIEPTLDLVDNPVLPPRPDPLPSGARLDPVWADVGARMTPIIAETRLTTLAGFVILNPEGVIVAGDPDLAMSLLHAEEVRAALAGRYASALRTREIPFPRPPVYSLSRGTQIRVFVAMPAFVDGQVAGVVYASRTPDNVLRQLYRNRGKVFLTGLLALALAGVVGFLFVRTLNRPIHQLIERTEAIARGDRGAIRPLDQHGTRELAQLTESFLAMAGKLSDRSDYLTTFAAHVSHELKAPLTSIRGAAELLADSVETMTHEERERFLSNIVADAGRLTLLVERLRDLARADNPNTGGASTLREAADALAAAQPGLAIRLEGEADRCFAMSLENVRIVLGNLLDNARRHGARSVEIRGEFDDDDLVVTVADDGEGVSDANRAKIFDPFFTTRREAGGTGMGLVIVAAMLRAHGGSIALLSTDGGAAFQIRIPLTF